MNALASLKGRLDVLTLGADAKRVRAERLTYLSPNKLHRLERFCDEAVAAVPDGDVLEFGVALGGSAILLAKRARAAERCFAGFDVFAMIPPPASEKDDAKSKARYETIASGQSKGIGGDQYYGYRDNLYDEVCASFRRHGLTPHSEAVLLIKGLFEDTWPAYPAGPVAFAHIDCDWYDPVKFCLQAVAERMPPGGVILLDDYNDYGGCRTATDEFLVANRDFLMLPGENVALRRR